MSLSSSMSLRAECSRIEPPFGFAQGPRQSRMAIHSRFGLRLSDGSFARRVDVDRARLANSEMHVVGDFIDMDADGDALSEANPGEDGVYLGKALWVGGGVGVGDTAVEAFDVAEQFVVGVSHQNGACGVADVDVLQAGLFEVTG